VTQQDRARNPEPHVALNEDSWQAFFLAPELGPGGTAVNGLETWPTDHLLTEVLRRRADDAPALRLMQRDVLQALLIAGDRA
jgi:hypothetical protein